MVNQLIYFFKDDDADTGYFFGGGAKSGFHIWKSTNSGGFMNICLVHTQYFFNYLFLEKKS